MAACPSCAHENPDRARFCLECGAAFASRCPRCSAELPPAAKFESVAPAGGIFASDHVQGPGRKPDRPRQEPVKEPRMQWAGRIMSGIAVVFLLFDGVTKLMKLEW